MKFIVSSTALLKQLQSISGVLNSSNTLPILDNFLFEINKKQLTISASDLETTMITKMEVEAKEDGNIAIPAKLLIETLKNFPELPLTFSIDTKNYGIEISSDNGKFKLSGHSGDEFPKVPNIEASSKVVVPADVLQRAITKTLFATGNDDLRPVMSGVYCQLSSSEFIFVATDAHKLVRFTQKECKADKSASFILPKKPLNLLKNQLASANTDVTIEFNQTNAMFTFDNHTLVCRLIDGKYPNYEAVIPKQNPNKLTIDRGTFLSSLKRVSVFSNKTTHQVRLKIAGSELAISAEDLDYANEAMERLTCSYEGEDMEIGFNSRFVIDMLNNIDTSDIVLEMSAPNRAGIILPAENDKGGENVLMLVMPIMLNN
ncbi:MAG: DNA polymerase III subunit beta [Bacteroidota bacterium]